MYTWYRHNLLQQLKNEMNISRINTDREDHLMFAEVEKSRSQFTRLSLSEYDMSDMRSHNDQITISGHKHGYYHINIST